MAAASLAPTSIDTLQLQGILVMTTNLVGFVLTQMLARRLFHMEDLECTLETISPSNAWMVPGTVNQIPQPTQNLTLKP